LLRGRFAVRIPEIEFRGDSFVGYRFIEAEPLLRDHVLCLGKQRQTSVAAQLAALLRDLHSVRSTGSRLPRRPRTPLSKCLRCFAMQSTFQRYQIHHLSRNDEYGRQCVPIPRRGRGSMYPCCLSLSDSNRALYA
jgi:hypothetical protein